MSVEDDTGFSLKRWSRRKLAATRGAPARTAVAVESEGAAPAAISQDAEIALPSVDSLTFESDFTPFMRVGVDDGLRRTALRKLLRDPRFNVMDGLDVYIDDYSKADPLEPAIVRTLMQARYLFAPAETDKREEGQVEDVPARDVAGEEPGLEA